MVDINKPVCRVGDLVNGYLFVSSTTRSGPLARVSPVPHLVRLNTRKMFYGPRLPVKTAVPVLKQAL